ncbi:14746_t:CDS:2, partial [Acaulospora colombiana]
STDEGYVPTRNKPATMLIPNAADVRVRPISLVSDRGALERWFVPVPVLDCVAGSEMRTPGIGSEAALQADTKAAKE